MVECLPRMRGALGPILSTMHMLDMMARACCACCACRACRACHPSTQEEETGGSEAQGRPWCVGILKPAWAL